MTVVSKTRILGYMTLLILVAVLFASGALLLQEGEESAEFDYIVPMSFDLFCQAVCIFLFLTLMSDKYVDRASNYFVMLICVEFVTFSADLFSIYSIGRINLRSIAEFGFWLTFLCSILIVFVMWCYIDYSAGTRDPRRSILNKVVLITFGFDVLFIAANPIFHQIFYIGDAGEYCVGSLYYVTLLAPAIIDLIIVYAITKYVVDLRKKFALYSFTAMPLIVVYVTIIWGGLELINPILLAILLLLYGNFYVGRSEDLMRKDAELVKQRAEILVSQIQPHFLYNALTSIMNIKGNPLETRDAIADFGKYLRGNLDTLKQRAPIPFLKELNHIENFMMLEKLNLGGGITLETRVNAYNFLVPALSIQKLIELYIENEYPGECPKGNMVLTVDETDNSHVITLEGDGIGSDMVMFMDGNDTDTLGVHTIKSRLEDQVDGTLDIDCNPGKGTIITVAIPKANVQVKRSYSHKNIKVQR